MNNTTVASGVDPAIPQLHTLHVTSQIIEQMDISMALDQVDMNLSGPQEHPDVTLLHDRQGSDAFLTDVTPRGALPHFWQCLLPKTHQKRAQRMYTRGDGSCAKGAVLLAIETPHHPRRTLWTFRTSDHFQLLCYPARPL